MLASEQNLPGFRSALVGSLLLHALLTAILFAVGGHSSPPGEPVLQVLLTPPRRAQRPSTPTPAPLPQPSRKAPAVAPLPPRTPTTVPARVSAPVPATEAAEPVSLADAAAAIAAPAATIPSLATDFPAAEDAVPAAATGPAPAVSSALRAGYLVTVRSAIELRKEYPLLARRGGQQGTVVVSFLLNCDGRLLDLTIVASSGRTLLDRAALQAVQTVGRFPPFPAELGRDNLAFEVPIAFRLDQR